jgi:hypothetical protein
VRHYMLLVERIHHPQVMSQQMEQDLSSLFARTHHIGRTCMLLAGSVVFLGSLIVVPPVAFVLIFAFQPRLDRHTTVNHLPIFLAPTTMKITSVLLIALAVPCEGFQFMSKWKMPTHDPNQEKIQEKFGDKSKSSLAGLRCRDCCFIFRCD